MISKKEPRIHEYFYIIIRVFVAKISLFNQYQSSKKILRTNAAQSQPAMGATMKSQSCCNAIPPAKSAGPKLRAGFTEVPVIGITTICIKANEIPMASPAIIGEVCLDAVAPKITIKKRKVKTNSAISAEVILYSPR